MIKTIDYDIKRGDTISLKKFKILDSNGETLELKSTDQLYFTMKKDANQEPEVQKTIGNGIEYCDDGYYRIVLEADDTNNLKPLSYVYDIEVKTGSGIVKTIIEGTITLDNDVTQKGDEV